ncbi:SDR family oxidoreductase [Granulicella sp. dw_53]|uniref:SDR family NAD(P)-dependent oxidoreductase n=1 Tax=Granulicella sp. dw_53 TaxID=2719792 RepID=UPI001BD59528|nr:SDR family oxidoreductase [Granulicella sp. dw_53]
MRLKGKTLFVAGASGMAASTVQLALAEGARVFAVDRNPDAIRSLVSTVSSSSDSMHTYCADLASEEGVELAFKECLHVFGEFDAVFYAVGMSGRQFGDGTLHECTFDGWEITHRNNSTSAFLVSRRALQYFLSRDPVMPANLRGTILNMASVLAYSPQRDFFATHAYAASKGAVIAMTLAAAAYYAASKININAIAPGLVATPMSVRAQNDPTVLEFLKHKQPLPGTLLDAEEVAQAAVFLLSNEARYITGQVLAVDGGWTVSN